MLAAGLCRGPTKSRSHSEKQYTYPAFNDVCNMVHESDNGRVRSEINLFEKYVEHSTDVRVLATS
jgi:hypothetical protein